MARIREDQPLVPSVLDRLLDDRPEEVRETTRMRSQVMSDMRQAIRRDLENLLNTRCRPTSWPPELTELERSLVAYGIPDLAAANLASGPGRRRFLATVERTIRTFEPRFKSIKVVEVANSDYLDRTLRFRIDALLYAYPAPEPVVFDSAVEPATGEFQVRGTGR